MSQVFKLPVLRLQPKIEFIEAAAEQYVFSGMLGKPLVLAWPRRKSTPTT
jgi:hypothetical protein